MLAGIIQAPEAYAPGEGLKARQDTVINVLVDQGILDADEAPTIKEQPLYIKPLLRQQQASLSGGLYKCRVGEHAGSKSLYQAGLKIYTTIDSRMQNTAEKTVQNHARSLAYRGVNARDIALVSIEPSTGGIKAMVGSRFLQKPA